MDLDTVSPDAFGSSLRGLGINILVSNVPRGLGVELRLYDSDPDTAAVRAEAMGAMGAMILQAPSDKPHGLRECAILGPDGYLWVPSRPL